MSNPYKNPHFHDQLRPLLEVMAGEGIQRAMQGLSQMTGQLITVTQPTVTLIALSEISNLLGGPENEAVGVYLRAEGEMSGQIMLIFPYESALKLVASMLGMEARPTPPAVMVDMVAAILDVIIATAAGVSEHVLMLSATFIQGDREAEASFWVIPDPRVLEAFMNEENK